jgi:putative ATPase
MFEEFEKESKEGSKINTAHMPLPERVRPALPDDLSGQDAIWSPTSTLKRLVETDRYTSLLFWGPPGTGKTSLARIIAGSAKRAFTPMSAVMHGVKEIRSEIQRSQSLTEDGKPAVLIFMDEIHRLSKSQQDALLPALEAGHIKFIGATTENPSFEVNNAILSRSLVFKFNKLSKTALTEILQRAVSHEQSRLVHKSFATDLLTSIADAADGDVRKALNILDAIDATVGGKRPDGKQSTVTIEDTRNCKEFFNAYYDKHGESHYDTASALIKSIRASKPDAAIYYLARMLEGGEDPVFIARRIVIAASEDVGNANPTALLLATSAMQAVHMVGMPEARIILSQAVTYLAASPKSNRAYLAIDEALADVKEAGMLEIPLHLRNAPTKLMKDMGYGKSYIYAHDDPRGAAKQQYLPDELRTKKYYRPLKVGAEAQLAKNLETLEKGE